MGWFDALGSQFSLEPGTVLPVWLPHAGGRARLCGENPPLFLEQEAGLQKEGMHWSFPAGSPSHVEERPSRVPTWTCGRCCSCLSSSASAPGMKVNSNLQPLIHLPDVFNRAEKKKYQMVEQLILRESPHGQTLAVPVAWWKGKCS